MDQYNARSALLEQLRSARQGPQVEALDCTQQQLFVHDRVAEAVRRTVGRASDQVSRYGGEEFVVVLGNTPLEGALKIAENIRLAVQNLGILHKDAKNHGIMTVSVGVTSTQPTRQTRPETVLVAADRAMYNAKHAGKNQVAYSTAARTGIYQALCLPSDMETRMS